MDIIEESETSTLFSLSDSLAQQLFRDVPGEKARYQSLNEYYFWPFDEPMRTYERLVHQWHQVMADGSLFWEPTARKGELAKMLKEAGSSAKVMDVGCGVLGLWPSAMAVEFPECTAVGIDLAPSEDEYAPPNLSWEIWDVVQGLPFKENDFDAIRISAMAPFLPNYAALINEALRCLKPNGILMVTEPECVLHNSTTGTQPFSIDWAALQATVNPTISILSATHYHIIKDIVEAAETREWKKDGTGYAGGEAKRFREVFEHEITMAVGSWEGLAPSDALLGQLKKEIVLLLWSNRLLEPDANQALVCEQLEWVKRLVEDPEARVVTRQKLVWARK